jgi:hypothetical protein
MCDSCDNKAPYTIASKAFAACCTEKELQSVASRPDVANAIQQFLASGKEDVIEPDDPNPAKIHLTNTYKYYRERIRKSIHVPIPEKWCWKCLGSPYVDENKKHRVEMLESEKSNQSALYAR